VSINQIKKLILPVDIIHDAPLKRASWARHGVRGFYLGPALSHYLCHICFVPKTGANRISDTLAHFPDPLFPFEDIVPDAEPLPDPTSSRPQPAFDGLDLVGKSFVDSDLGVGTVLSDAPPLFLQPLTGNLASGPRFPLGWHPTLRYRTVPGDVETSTVTEVARWIRDQPPPAPDLAPLGHPAPSHPRRLFVPFAVAPPSHVPSLHRWRPLLDAALVLPPCLAPHSRSHPLLSRILCLFPPFSTLTIFAPLHCTFLVPLCPSSPIGPLFAPVPTPTFSVSFPPDSFRSSALPTVSPSHTFPFRPWDLRGPSPRPLFIGLSSTRPPSSTWTGQVSPSRSAPPLPGLSVLRGSRKMGRS
jgi:hypothetical protein